MSIWTGKNWIRLFVIFPKPDTTNLNKIPGFLSQKCLKKWLRYGKQNYYELNFKEIYLHKNMTNLKLDRLDLIIWKTRDIKAKLSWCSEDEILLALRNAYDEAQSKFESLSPETEEDFQVSVMWRCMFSADRATTLFDEFRSAFAWLGLDYLHEYKWIPLGKIKHK